MKKQRLYNANDTIITYLNINLLKNKFVFVKDIIKLFDVFLVSESKLDHTFASNKFRIIGYKIFKLDRNRFGGGLFCTQMKIFHPKHYKNKNIFQILKLLGFNFSKIIKSEIRATLFKIEHNFKPFLKNYDNVTIIRDFNLSINDVPIESFLQAYSLTSLIKEATRFQSSKPSYIDLILTNPKNICKLSNTFELGHLITINYFRLLLNLEISKKSHEKKL